MKLAFDNRFAALRDIFHTRMPPEGVATDPWLIHANPAGAALIGADIADPDFAHYFSGMKPLPGGDPLAMVYSGHQFGQWAGQLGDGRALLLGQVRNERGELWDIQLKGGGKTPYSRFGDGRAVLRSCIREYLCSEAMAALSIPTTRSLSIVGTGQPVFREQPEPGAVFTRLARSHIRFGHFEHFYYNDQYDSLRILADHVIAEHFPGLTYAQWFAEVIARTARLMAQWQVVGFCHGVMNTDNMSILGLTLDYGPFGFMEAFDHRYICNHSDHQGRYVYDQQPNVGLWNLYALAHALQPLIPAETSSTLLQAYDEQLGEAYTQLMRAKLGIIQPQDGDDELWLSLLQIMVQQQADYTLTFRALAASFADSGAFLSQFTDAAPAQAWLADYHYRMKGEEGLPARLNAINPKYVLRNWVAETVIRAAEDDKDYSLLNGVLAVLQAPYDEHASFAHLAAPAPVEYRELCVSCSS